MSRFPSFAPHFAKLTDADYAYFLNINEVLANFILAIYSKGLFTTCVLFLANLNQQNRTCQPNLAIATEMKL